MAVLLESGVLAVILVVLSVTSVPVKVADSTQQRAATSTVVPFSSFSGSLSLVSCTSIAHSHPGTTNVVVSQYTLTHILSTASHNYRRSNTNFGTIKFPWNATAVSATSSYTSVTAGRRSRDSWISVGKRIVSTAVATSTAVPTSASRSKTNLTVPYSSSKVRDNVSGTCEMYRGGQLCSSVRSNQTVYVDPNPRYRQENVEVLLQGMYKHLRTFVTPTQYSLLCLNLIEEGLCRYGFPKCRETQSGQAERSLWCRSNCIAVVRGEHACKDIFSSVIGTAFLYLGTQQFVPSKVDPNDFNCPESLPTKQSSSFTCMDIISESDLPYITPPSSLSPSICNKSVNETAVGNNSCMFPFLYKNVTYRSCTNVNSFEEWNYWCYAHDGRTDQRTTVNCECPNSTLDATCQRYSGGFYCSRYQADQRIFVDTNCNQDFLAKAMQQLGKHIDSNMQKSDCRGIVKEGVCNILFPPCLSLISSGAEVYPRLLCRETCEQIRYGNCSDDFHMASSIIAQYLETNRLNPVHVYAGELPCHRMPSTTNVSKHCVTLTLNHSFAGYPVPTATSSPTSSLFSGTVMGLTTAGIAVLLLAIIIVIICWVRLSRQHKKVNKAQNIAMSDRAALEDFLMDWPSYEDIQLPRDRLTFLRELGHGQFGQVYLAKATSIVKDETETLVAVKTMRKKTRDVADDFKKDIDIMTELDSPYIIRLLGVCTTQEPVFLITEYMSCGDLRDFVIDARPDPKTGTPAKLLPDMLIRLCRQIAAGVAYMASVHFVHRDIAARNCLVNEGLVVKVGDFGMSRDVYRADYYKRTGGTIPLRWMAPEAIKDGRYTVESDVWALGVVLWEVFAFGHQPYYGMSNMEVLQGVCERDLRLQKPSGCPNVVYSLMMSCWNSSTKERTKASRLAEKLERLEQGDNVHDTEGYVLPSHGHYDGKQVESDEVCHCNMPDLVNVFDDKEEMRHETPCATAQVAPFAGSSDDPSQCQVLSYLCGPVFRPSVADDDVALLAAIESTLFQRQSNAECEVVDGDDLPFYLQVEEGGKPQNVDI